MNLTLCNSASAEVTVQDVKTKRISVDITAFSY